MRAGIVALIAFALFASPAFADDYASSRDVQAAVDSYLATGAEDASLVGGTGSAGYDAGFWIRGGDFLLRINATLQARYEAWDWDDEDAADDRGNDINAQDVFAGDTSGFSLPRATLKFSGEAPCNICYYIELEFGHFGRDVADARKDDADDGQLGPGSTVSSQTFNFDNTREAWIEWCYSPIFNVRMGQVQLPSTRQLMTAPELQQFVDISLGSAAVLNRGIGKTDRNRDHGLLIHGAFGCNNEWSYLASITNGDGGDSVRNVLDHRTSDNLAYGARLNWAFLAPIGYEEGALRQATCQWYGEVGAWGIYYADRSDKGHTDEGNFQNVGLDLALGWGGFSFTAAYTLQYRGDPGGTDDEESMWLVQLGYHFPGTAWEIAARASGYRDDLESGNTEDGGVEYAFGVNYYLNGHANKLQLDVAFIETDHNDDLFSSYYPGYQDGVSSVDGDTGNAVMLRFQWQLAL